MKGPKVLDPKAHSDSPVINLNDQRPRYSARFKQDKTNVTKEYASIGIANLVSEISSRIRKRNTLEIFIDSTLDSI